MKDDPPSMRLVERRVRERGWTLEEALSTPVGRERRPRPPGPKKKLRDLAGWRFGQLLVVRFDGRDEHARAFWICRCTCGAEKRAQHSNLLAGRTRSCGCAPTGHTARIRRERGEAA